MTEAAILTALQKAAAQAIVNVFETGHPLGDYGAVAVLPGDAGHLSYGRSQASLGSGALSRLLSAYVQTAAARLADALRPFLPRLEARDPALDTDADLHRLLREAADDPVMRRTQDRFFDAGFWHPAVEAATSLGVALPLSIAVVYDSHVHGSWETIRDRVLDHCGRPSRLGEPAWIERYVATRRSWLATSSNEMLRHAVYRMDGFNELIAADKWRLELPFTVHGVRIDRGVLAGKEPPRLLRLADPPLHGDDVRHLQEALCHAGFPLDADGVFGPQTEEAVRRFQQRAGLQVDGVVGVETWGALGLGSP